MCGIAFDILLILHAPKDPVVHALILQCGTAPREILFHAAAENVVPILAVVEVDLLRIVDGIQQIVCIVMGKCEAGAGFFVFVIGYDGVCLLLAFRPVYPVSCASPAR